MPPPPSLPVAARSLSRRAFVGTGLLLTGGLALRLPATLARALPIPHAALDQVPFPTEHREWTRAAFSADGRFLALGGRGGSVTLLDAVGQVVAGVAGQGSPITGLAFAPGEPRLAGTTLAGDLHQWRLPDLAPLAVTGGTTAAYGLAWFAGARYLASLHDQSRLLLRQMTPGAALIICHQGAHQGHLATVACHPAGQALVTGGWDGTVRVSTGHPPLGNARLVARHDDWVTALAFSPSGQHLASCAWDGSVQLSDWHDGALTTTRHLRVPGTWLASVRFSADGARLYAAGGDGAVHAWQVADGRSLAPWLVGSWAINTLAVCPRGQSLVAAGDGPTLAWRSETT